jgi:hypothetical protein
MSARILRGRRRSSYRAPRIPLDYQARRRQSGSGFIVAGCGIILALALLAVALAGCSDTVEAPPASPDLGAVDLAIDLEHPAADLEARDTAPAADLRTASDLAGPPPSTDLAPACGGLGQPCCSAGACNHPIGYNPLSCDAQSSTCVGCGLYGQPCCPIGYPVQCLGMFSSCMLTVCH